MPLRVAQTSKAFCSKQCYNVAAPQCFSTSSASLAYIPPESPRFIEIPRPVQPSQPYRPWVKGVLPVPRPIFRSRPKPTDPDKASAEYLANVTPEPREDRTPAITDARAADYISWKARQSEARRRNLREGLWELHNRKQQSDRAHAFQSRKRQAEREALDAAPEREDERLTNATVLQSELPARHHILTDPNRSARLAQKRENVAQMSALREENRRNALHTLYMNAGSFITTGEQLDAVVDKMFDDPNQFANDERRGQNIWSLGYPETVAQLLAEENQTLGKKAVAPSKGNAGITKARMRRIAEELTGGKMMDSE